jgi:DNA polymerase family B
MTPKHTVVMDIECYPNFFLVGFKNVKTGNIRSWQLYGEGESFDAKSIADIRAILSKMRIVTFNGINFDMPLLTVALAGATCKKLKACTNAIIEGGLRFWQIEKKYNVTISKDIDHIDIINVAFGQASLKLYAGRLHAPKMQDLPFDPGQHLTVDEARLLTEYWVNDLENTILLYKRLQPQLDLRQTMSAEYGIDLRSKSDAQIAEAVIKQAIERSKGYRVYCPDGREGDRFRYKPPVWMRFQLPQLESKLYELRREWFVVNDKGGIDPPTCLKDATVSIAAGVYRMGIGGLHSSESAISHRADQSMMLIDRDVTSYYPAIVLNLKLYPEHLGEDFLRVYRSIVNERVKAKHAGEKVKADALKIVANGTYGKLGSRWSILYSPELLIQVTLTGQLALLMLIEMLHFEGIEVASANTDGVLIKCPHARYEDANRIIGNWEQITGFNTEESQYAAIYSRDVNSYVAIKLDGSTKTKGKFSIDDDILRKNPDTTVCVEAAIKYLTKGDLPQTTIYNETDVRKFVSIQTVKGGAVTHREEYLGKAVRWYYAKYQDDLYWGVPCLRYKTNGNLVPDSTGGKPMMQLADSLPDDLDHGWYIKNTYKLLESMGATVL